jgi:Fe-S-cluster containining protein
MMHLKNILSISDFIHQADTLLNPFDGICPTGCHACEFRESMLLINEEAATRGYKDVHLNAFKHESSNIFYLRADDGPCPFLLNGTCSDYSIRPVDCRIFPLFPIFDIDLRQFRLAIAGHYCPLHLKVQEHNTPDWESFVLTVYQICSWLNDMMPDSWKHLYNEINLLRMDDLGAKFLSIPQHRTYEEVKFSGIDQCL